MTEKLFQAANSLLGPVRRLKGLPFSIQRVLFRTPLPREYRLHDLYWTKHPNNFPFDNPDIDLRQWQEWILLRVRFRIRLPEVPEFLQGGLLFV